MPDRLRGSRRGKAAVVAALCGLFALLAVLPASATPAEPFTASVDVGSAPAGATQSFVYAVTNTSDSLELGSVDVAIPEGWTIVSITEVVASDPKSWSGTIGVDAIELRADSSEDDLLGGGEWVTVTFEATLPCDPGDDPYELVPTAKSTHDFTGDADFALDGTTPEVEVTGQCSLAFGTQPSETEAGEAIGSAGAVTVEVLDGAGEVIEEDDSTQVTVELESGPLEGVLAGTVTQTAVDGVATFADLSITKAGPYTLSADPDDDAILGATSDEFEIVPGPAASLVLDPIVDQVVDVLFTVHATTLDQYGNPEAPVTDATDVQLTVVAGTGALTGGPLVTISASGTAGADFSVAYTKIENFVRLRVDDTAGDALAFDDSNLFDVLEVIVSQASTPNAAATLNGECTDATPANPTCVTLFLPNGGSGDQVLREGSCVGKLADCFASVVDAFGDLKDGLGQPLYTRAQPARVVVQLDKTIAKMAATKIHVFMDFGPGFVELGNCKNKGVVNAGAEGCVNTRNSTNAGDRVLEILFVSDPRIGFR